MNDDSLQRFVDAQAGTYAQALVELQNGEKRGHWMWFVLPQLRGLGHSDMAKFYGLANLAEARAYAAHPVLGPRLVACVRAMLRHRGTAPDAILGGIDALKFRSCLTLFAHAAPDEPIFASALDAFYGGEPDMTTLRLLGAA